MPRQARDKGEFCTYHIIQRGNERKEIFHTDDDRYRFLETLNRMKEKYNIIIEAYCLMDNHVHLLINDNGNDISKVIKSINISYVYYFNRIYQRVRHLFQDRFKSELINDDIYLIQVSKYIHNNPVKAGIVSKAEGYKWSSIQYYIERGAGRPGLVDTTRIMKIFSNNKFKAIQKYRSYVSELDEEIDAMDIDEIMDSPLNTDFINTMSQAREKINELLKDFGKSYDEIMKDKNERNKLIIKIRKNSSLNLKQIGELFGGLSESRICRILESK